MGLFELIGRQAQHPEGLLGRIAVRVMGKATAGHVRWTAGLLGPRDDDHVLDVGFGAGASVALLASRVPRGQVTGVEPSRAAIEVAARRNAAAIAAGSVRLVQAAGGALPFSDASFDKACSVDTVYVIEDPGGLFRELRRVLRPGGLAAVGFPERERFLRLQLTRARGFYPHRLADLEAAFRDAGFANVRVERNERLHTGGVCLLGTG